MDDQAAAEIAPLLAPGETLIWAGRPYPPAYLFYNGGGMGFLSIPVIFITSIAYDWRVALLFPLLIGLAFVGRYRGDNVRYGLTARRAIILRKWPWRTVESIATDRFNVCIRQNFGKGIASIMFRKTPDPFNFWRGTPFRADAFVGLSDADKVEKLIEGFSHHRVERV